jgi:hypothetical protein
MRHNIKLFFFAFLFNVTSDNIKIMQIVLLLTGILSIGRAIAEAVSRWLPTSAARVRARGWQLGFVVDRVASGQVFAQYFGLPCQNRSFHQLLHHHNQPGQLAEAL